MPVVLALDAGTTGVRTRAVFTDGRPSVASYREFTQHFPQPGWVEHDAVEIWEAVKATLLDVLGQLDEPVAAIGITNQRETVVAWDRHSGTPLHRAIVWQDRRTAARCDALRDAGHLPLVRERTGLVLDPYFSGTKMAWLLTPEADGGGGVPTGPDLALGTIDSLAAVEPDRRRGPGHRHDQRQPHHALRHRLDGPGAPSWASCSASPSTPCRRCGRRAGASA